MVNCSGCSCIKNADDDTKFCGTKIGDYQYGCDESCCTNCKPSPYVIPSASSNANKTPATFQTNQYANPLLLDTTGEVKMYDQTIDTPKGETPTTTTTTTATYSPRLWIWVVGGVVLSIIIVIALYYMMSSSSPAQQNMNTNYNGNMNTNYNGNPNYNGNMNTK
jgi:hypothetical protein